MIDFLCVCAGFAVTVVESGSRALQYLGLDGEQEYDQFNVSFAVLSDVKCFKITNIPFLFYFILTAVYIVYAQISKELEKYYKLLIQVDFGSQIQSKHFGL